MNTFVRFFKNKLGDFRGYGGCPNCGDSWAYKPTGSLKMDEHRGVLICKECLDNPKAISVGEVTMNLIDYGWPADKLNLALKAVTEHKKTAYGN